MLSFAHRIRFRNTTGAAECLRGYGRRNEPGDRQWHTTALLRPRHHGPRHRAAEARDELPSSHPEILSLEQETYPGVGFKGTVVRAWPALAPVKGFGCRPVTDRAARCCGRRPKASRGGNRGWGTLGVPQSLWGFDRSLCGFGVRTTRLMATVVEWGSHQCRLVEVSCGVER